MDFGQEIPKIAQKPPDQFLNIKLSPTCISLYKQVIQL